MVLLQHKKLVYIDIPKTGSSSIDKALITFYGGVNYCAPRIFNTHKKHERILPEYAKNYSVVTCVRNPYTRAYSFYKFLTAQENIYGNFVNFLNHLIKVKYFAGKKTLNVNTYILFNQHSYLYNTNYSYVIKFENLEEDFFKIFGHKNFIFPREKVLNYKKREFTDEEKNLIMEWAEEDFNIFGYEK